MKRNLNLLRALACLTAGILAIQNSTAANSVWSGASGSDIFWGTAGNWSPSGVPATANDALFFDPGASNNNISASSIVTGNMTVHALRFGQTNGIQNLFINSGVTLTVAGINDNGYGQLGVNPAAAAMTNGFSTLNSGSWPGPGVATLNIRITNTISGPGTLILNNTNNEMIVRYANGQNTPHFAVLDMSGLSAFTANLARIGVGYGQPGDTVRAMGELLLAQTNNITLSGTNSADISDLIVGDNTGNNDGNSTTALLFLGNKNILNVDQMLISGQKTPGQMLLNPLFSSPTIVMRGSDGVSRVSKIRVGDESDAGVTSGPSLGTVNLLAGTSDILADTIILGKGQNGNGAPANMSGTLILGSGTLDVNTLQLAAQFVSNQGGTVTGIATFSNTTVVVNKLLELGHSTGAAAARNATLNISGGSFTVVSNLVTGGTATINVTNSVLALKAHPSLLASVMNLDGGSISNAATLKVTNTLNIVDNGNILGNPVLDMGSSPSAVWNVSGIQNGVLTISNLFQGSGTINGNLTQAAGATISPGGSGAAGTLTVNGNMTLNAGTLKFDLSNSGGGVNDQINESGGIVTLNGTNAVNLSSLSGAFDTVNPYTLISSGGLVGGDQTYFTPAGGLGQSRYTFTFSTDASTVKLSVSGVGPANLTWVGDGSLNNWDLKNTFNWNNGASAQFFSLDAVTFNDSGSASPAINLVGTLNPGSITVTNGVKNYTFSGTGGVIGSPLTKDGTASLTFNNTGDDSFGGLVTILNGAVNFGNAGQNTFVGGLTLTGGSATFSGGSTNVITAGNSVAIGTGTSLMLANSNANTFNGAPIEVDGSMTVTQAVDSTIDGAIAGAGAFTKAGGGALTLSGVNSGLSSVVQINGGTIRAGTTTALGTGGVIITNSATLDLKGFNLGAIPVTVSGSGVGGNGAIVSTTAILISGVSGIGLNNVTMTGNTTFGGSGPWDTDPIRNFGAWGISAGTLSTGGTNYSLTKVGLNQVSLNNSTVDAALGDIDVQQGLLDLAGSTTSLGNPTNTITVRAGAQLSFNSTSTQWDKKFILFGDGATPNLLDYNGANTVIGSVTLNGSCVVSTVPANRGAPVSITLNNSIGGTGSLIKSGIDSLILNGTNNYAGTTTVSGGKLFVEGINTGTNNVTVSGGVLGGIGTINGPVTVSSGGTLFPGDANTAFGTLTISNRLTLGGTFSNNLDKTSGVFSSGVITNITTLAIGGTLQLNITGDTALAAGDSFKLFSFGTATGAFTSINPSIPGTGLIWDTSHLTANGTLGVIVAPPAQPAIGSVTLSGTSLVLNITNGVTGGTNYVLTSTNVATPIAQWTPVATNIFDSNGNSLWTNTVVPSKPQQFFLIQLP